MSSATAGTPNAVTGDYQGYVLDTDGRIASVNDRIRAKLYALGQLGTDLSLAGRSVLDVGTDHGFFALLASSLGARTVLGLDRNREVKGRGWVDLIGENQARAAAYPLHKRVRFLEMNIGQEWRHLGAFEVVYCMSVYHHLYANCGSHEAVWCWLAEHTMGGGTLIWEGPTDLTDPVAARHIPREFAEDYHEASIVAARARYFDIVIAGPAGHEPTRKIYVLRRRDSVDGLWASRGLISSGAGGASAAFMHANARRCDEIERILGFRPFPGSFNVHLARPFPWHHGFVRAQVLDPVQRGNPESPWSPRWCRFYRVRLDPAYGPGVVVHLMRFEGERYPASFAEAISPYSLRPMFDGEDVQVWRPN